MPMIQKLSAVTFLRLLSLLSTLPDLDLDGCTSPAACASSCVSRKYLVWRRHALVAIYTVPTIHFSFLLRDSVLKYLSVCPLSEILVVSVHWGLETAVSVRGTEPLYPTPTQTRPPT